MQSSKDGPHSPPKQHTRSKRAAKVSKELQQLRRWTGNKTKLELTFSYAPGCAVSYIGSLGEDYKDDTFSFEPDAPPAQSSMTLGVWLLQPSHSLFFRCQVFELPQDVFRFSQTTTPDFDLIIWPQDYDYEIQSSDKGKRLILESQSDSLTIMIADTAESLEEAFRSLSFKTSLIQ